MACVFEKGAGDADLVGSAFGLDGVGGAIFGVSDKGHLVDAALGAADHVDTRASPLCDGDVLEGEVFDAREFDRVVVASRADFAYF